MSAIFTDSSGPAAALAFQKAGVEIAWGNGNPAWDSVPVPVPSNATSLVAEIGRRRASSLLFVLPDSGGEIIVNSVRYAQSLTPTRNLFVLAHFDKLDGVGQDIREAAVFVGTVLNLSVPGDQFYFAPSDLQNAGQMLLCDRFTVQHKTADFGVDLQFVMTF